MTLSDEDLAIAGYDNACRFCQSFRRVTGNTGCADCQQDLTLRAEFDDDVAFGLFVRVLLALALIGAALIDHPHIVVSVEIDLVRKNEHVGAKALEKLARRIKLQDRRHHRTGAAIILKWG